MLNRSKVALFGITFLMSIWGRCLLFNFCQSTFISKQSTKVFLVAKPCTSIININEKSKPIFTVNKMYNCQWLLHLILLVPCSYPLNYHDKHPGIQTGFDILAIQLHQQLKFLWACETCIVAQMVGKFKQHSSKRWGGSYRRRGMLLRKNMVNGILFSIVFDWLINDFCALLNTPNERDMSFTMMASYQCYEV